MVNESFLYNSFREKERLPETSKYFYGSKIYNDAMFYDPEFMPRFGTLARKALAHYAGKYYNPHNGGFEFEIPFRGQIERIIKEKIFYHRKKHDWVYIDNYFKKMTSDFYGLDLKYDAAIVEAGHSPDFAPPLMNELPI